MTFAMLESIKVPTLLITGDADLYAPPSLLPMFASRIKGAQTLVIPEAGIRGIGKNRKCSIVQSSTL
jgi:pimeloyl-ACP methyl ester carboxylesterase